MFLFTCSFTYFIFFMKNGDGTDTKSLNTELHQTCEGSPWRKRLATNIRYLHFYLLNYVFIFHEKRRWNWQGESKHGTATDLWKLFTHIQCKIFCFFSPTLKHLADTEEGTDMCVWDNLEKGYKSAYTFLYFVAKNYVKKDKIILFLNIEISKWSINENICFILLTILLLPFVYLFRQYWLGWRREKMQCYYCLATSGLRLIQRKGILEITKISLINSFFLPFYSCQCRWSQLLLNICLWMGRECEHAFWGGACPG